MALSRTSTKKINSLSTESQENTWSYMFGWGHSRQCGDYWRFSRVTEGTLSDQKCTKTLDWNSKERTQITSWEVN